MRDLYKYKYSAQDIIYFIQTNESIHLSDKSHHDIYTNVEKAVRAEADYALYLAEYYEDMYKEIAKKEFPMKWNELRITLAQHVGKEITAEQVLQWMFMRDEGERTR